MRFADMIPHPRTSGLVLTTALLLGLMSLSGCDRSGGNETPFRDGDKPIGAIVRFEPDRANVDWHVRAAYPGDEDLRTVRLVDIGSGEGTVTMIRSECDNGVCTPMAQQWPAEQLGTARYQLGRKAGKEATQMWVLWIDEGFRTMVVGSPKGRYAWILDRKPTGGADRIKAAREMLDFNGYDLTRLQMRP